MHVNLLISPLGGLCLLHTAQEAMPLGSLIDLCCGFEGPGQVWANVNSKMLEALHDLIYLAVDGGGLRTTSKAQYYLLCL